MNVIKSLEFDKILARLSEYAHSNAANAAILQVSPLGADFKTASKLLAETEEAFILRFTHGVSPDFAVDDTENILTAAAKGASLAMADLLKVASLLRKTEAAKKSILPVKDDKILDIQDEARALFENPRLERDISSAIVSETEVADNASSALKEIRKSMRAKNDKIREVLGRFIGSETLKKYLQEGLVTMRGGRYVLPVKAEFKGQVKGIVHDRSDSGQTLYIEPAAVVELNNDLRELQIRERAEIEAILRELSFKVGQESENLTLNTKILASLDVKFARAAFSRDIKGTKPVLNGAGIVDIKNARHPLIEAEKVIPVSVKLGGAYKILLITGPNTGGKTVTLKLIGLLTMMASSGLFVPAAEGTGLSVFERIYTDIGDEQSIEQSLSTFSAHMKNVIEVVRGAGQNCLVLLDELGAGTDPKEGGALSQAIIKHLLKSGASGVVTTHFSELKALAFKTDGLENASMGFDPETLQPTYKLYIGAPGASNALLIAGRLGLSTEILAEAESLLNSEAREFENVLKNAEEVRRVSNKYKEDAERVLRDAVILKHEADEDREFIRREREKLAAKTGKEAKRLLEKYLDEADGIIEELKIKSEHATEQNLFEARALRKRLEDSWTERAATEQAAEVKIEKREIEKIEGEIREGDRVFVNSLNIEGTVLSINAKKGECRVASGSLSVIIKLADLVRIKA